MIIRFSGRRRTIIHKARNTGYSLLSNHLSNLTTSEIHDVSGTAYQYVRRIEKGQISRQEIQKCIFLVKQKKLLRRGQENPPLQLKYGNIYWQHTVVSRFLSWQSSLTKSLRSTKHIIDAGTQSALTRSCLFINIKQPSYRTC